MRKLLFLSIVMLITFIGFIYCVVFHGFFYPNNEVLNIIANNRSIINLALFNGFFGNVLMYLTINRI